MDSKKILAMFGFVAFASLLFAESEKITVKSGSRQGKGGDVVFLEADLNGRAVDLTCLVSHSDCNVLHNGEYEMFRLAGEEAPTMTVRT